MLTARTLAHTFSVVTVILRIVPVLNDLLEIGAALAEAGEVILQEAPLAIDADGAEAALGCAGMGSLDQWLRERLPGVPVIDGVAAAVKLCEALHDQDPTTSKVGAFQTPGTKELVGVSPALRSAVGR
jgi:allantoin racemase